MRTGDAVLHRPSGETWQLAFVEGDRCAPCGWPPCMANVSDCELVEECTDNEHQELVARLRNMTNDHGGLDFRALAVRRLYPEAARA